MKTSLQNLKKRLFASAVAIAAFTGLNAQCVTSNTITNQGSGNITLMNQSTYSGGWDSYVSISFGDGISGFGTGTNFSSTHQFCASNGTYLVISDLFAYDPADSSVNCSYTDYDTVVVSDIACSVTVGTLSYSPTGQNNVYNFFCSVNSSNPGVQTNWIFTDSLGNVIGSANGTTAPSFTFPQGGYFGIGFSAIAYDSLTMTSCSDSAYNTLFINDGQFHPKWSM